jgi:hypothetical protein
MQYVAQEHPLGCFIACTAMVLEMSYRDVAAVVPLQEWDELLESGRSTLGPKAVEQMLCLAQHQGVEVNDAKRPLQCVSGCRYILAVSKGDPQVLHAIAVDESGAAYDPNEASLNKNWLDYKGSTAAALEFRLRSYH